MNGLQNPLKKVFGVSDPMDRSLVFSAIPTLVGGGSDGASVNIGQHTSIRERFNILTMDVLVLVLCPSPRISF